MKEEEDNKVHAELIDNLNQENDNTNKAYDDDEAKVSSKEAAKAALNKIKNGDKSPTLLNPIDSTHFVRSLKELNPNIKIYIKYPDNFAETKKALLEKANGEKALKELITDESFADKIIFNSEESKNEFLQAAKDYNINIDPKKIELNKNPLERLAGLPLNRRKRNADKTAKREQAQKLKRSAAKKNTNNKLSV